MEYSNDICNNYYYYFKFDMGQEGMGRGGGKNMKIEDCKVLS